jgi:preflagellin peptidase FlaK
LILPLNLLSLLSILTSIIALSLASISDLKHREVSDAIWLFYGLASLTLFLIRFIFNSNGFWLSITSIFLTSFISFLLFEAGFFGGADFKAMVCLSLAMPLYPKKSILILSFFHPFFPLSTLYNAFLFSCSYPIYILARNLLYFKSNKKIFNGLNHESKWKKLLVLILGYKEDFSKVENSTYLYPMEEIVWINNKALRKLRIVFDVESNREKLIENLKNAFAKDNISKMIWVTPGLPMIVFIALSFIVNLSFGDVLALLIKMFLLRIF